MSANPADADPPALNGSTEETAENLARREYEPNTDTADAPRDVDNSAARNRGAKSSSPLSQFENDRDMIEDDDADERQSSVTSSTIPLTSLDDSPNNRQRGPDAPTSGLHAAVPKTLGVATPFVTASHSDAKQSVAAQSIALPEATKPSNGAEKLLHSRDDDGGSDLTSDNEDYDISDDDDDEEGIEEEIDEDEDEDDFTEIDTDSDEEQLLTQGPENLHVS
jgi:hypothetical protein